MQDLKQADLSTTPDEDLTPEQRKELQRRLQSFARALSRIKGSRAPEAKAASAKWTRHSWKTAR